VCLTSRAVQVRIYSRAATLAQDALSSIKTIYACGAQQKIVNWYDEYLQTAYRRGIRSRSSMASSSPVRPFWSCQELRSLSGRLSVVPKLRDSRCRHGLHSRPQRDARCYICPVFSATDWGHYKCFVCCCRVVFHYQQAISA
jgi:hypothetical protein